MNHGMMEDAGSGGAIDDLGLEVAKLSAAAFAMAQVATERGNYAAHEASARALDTALRRSARGSTRRPLLRGPRSMWHGTMPGSISGTSSRAATHSSSASACASSSIAPKNARNRQSELSSSR